MSTTIDQPDGTEDSRRFFLAVAHFTRWIHSSFPKMAAEYSVSYQQVRVLYLVRTMQLGMSEIARQLQVAPTVITGMVDRLEAHGLIERQPDRSDRRRINLVLTDKGLAASRDIEQRYAESVEASIQKLSPEDQAALSRGLTLLSKVLTDLEVSQGGDASDQFDES